MAGTPDATPDAAQVPEDGRQETGKSIIERLFTKAFERWSKNQEASKGIELIAEVVSRIQAGQSFKEMETALAPVLNEQQAKTNLLQAVMFNHQMERVVLHWDMRWKLERDLWQDLAQQRLSSMEKLTLLGLVSKEAHNAAAYVNTHNPDFHPMTEVEPTLEQASAPALAKERAEIRADLEGTTPQGMEMLRRFTAKAKKRADELVDAVLRNEAAAKRNSSTQNE